MIWLLDAIASLERGYEHRWIFCHKNSFFPLERKNCEKVSPYFSPIESIKETDPFPQMYFSWILKWFKIIQNSFNLFDCIHNSNKFNKNCFWIWFKFLIKKSLILHYIFTLKMWYTASFSFLKLCLQLFLLIEGYFLFQKDNY